jgi:hypothetical protein
LHMKGNMKHIIFIAVQEMEFPEIAWYKIVVLSKLTYMWYNVDCKQGCRFLPHGNKGLHKLYELQWNRQNQMFNLWLTYVLNNATSNERKW